MSNLYGRLAVSYKRASAHCRDRMQGPRRVFGVFFAGHCWEHNLVPGSEAKACGALKLPAHR